MPTDLERWVRAWDVAGKFLADERIARLRAMTDDDARNMMAHDGAYLLRPDAYLDETGLRSH